MAEHLGPGVFISETGPNSRRIVGVPTFIPAIFGETERGPLEPTMVAGFADYRAVFGGKAGRDKFLPHAVEGFFANGGQRAYICRVVGSSAATAGASLGGLDLAAAGPGAWGNRIGYRIAASAAGFRLQLAYWDQPLPGEGVPDPFDPDLPPAVAPALIEDFDNLTWDDPASPDHFARRLADASKLATASSAALAEMPALGFHLLSGGLDGAAPTAADFAGETAGAGSGQGLAALSLAQFPEVALVAAPAAPDAVVAALIAHCETTRARFAVLDAPAGHADFAALDPRSAWDTRFAAFYYPWIVAADFATGQPLTMPPSGHVLGIYARVDATRGVWKAPANEVIQGALALEFQLNDQAQDILNPRSVNVIRQFPGRGIRVWGARTLSSDALWKYVSIRRLMTYLEQSIERGTQWAVFEPNGEALWMQFSETVRLFLRAAWRDGALMGVTEEQAFYVACDRRTMTQDDILSGRLICQVGIAPVRPAEFVMFRIFQQTATPD